MKTSEALNKCDVIFNPLIFKICMLVMTLFTAIPFVHIYIGKYVKAFLAYGILSVIYLVFRRGIRSVFKDKLGLLLLGFCASYAVTVILNRSSHFFENTNALIYMAVFFLLFFIFTSKKETYIIKEFEVLSGIVLVITFIFAIVNFFMFAFKVGGSYQVNGQPMYYGMYDNRLWGLYNANTNSMLCDISILLSLGFVLNKGYKKIIKVLCIINASFQYICLILTGSRASLYGLYMIVALIIFLTVVKFDYKNRVKHYLRSLSAAALSVVVLACANYFVRLTVPYLPAVCSNIKLIFSSDEEEKEFVFEKYDLTRIEEVEERDGGIFNGRMDLWKAGFATFKKSPVFGIGRENIYEFAKGELEGEKWSESLKVGGLHNIYMTILVSSGIIGFLLMAVFAVLSLFKMVKALFIKGQCNSWYIISFTMIILFYITEFVEARILYQVGVFYVIFWIYLGLAYALASSTPNKARHINEHSLHSEQ